MLQYIRHDLWRRTCLLRCAWVSKSFDESWREPGGSAAPYSRTYRKKKLQYTIHDVVCRHCCSSFETAKMVHNPEVTHRDAVWGERRQELRHQNNKRRHILSVRLVRKSLPGLNQVSRHSLRRHLRQLQELLQKLGQKFGFATGTTIVGRAKDGGWPRRRGVSVTCAAAKPKKKRKKKEKIGLPTEKTNKNKQRKSI